MNAFIRLTLAFRARPVLLVPLVCAAAWLGSLGTQELAPAFPGVPAAIEGTFPRDGHFHGEPLPHASHVRQWGSLAGDNAHTGSLVLGPFPAPTRLRLGVTGHPTAPAHELAVELVATGARHRIVLSQDIGVRWNIVDVDLPPAWLGQPVRLVARDDTRTIPGWFGVTEPLRGGRGEGRHGLRETFAAFTLNAALLALPFFAALRLLSRHSAFAPHWLPLAAGAAVALAGYLLFWLTLAHPRLGLAGNVLLFLASAAFLLRPSPASASVPRRHPEPAALVALTAGVGFLYLALLHLYPSSLEFDALAANRFRENLPGDNTLPHNFAAALFSGQSPKSLAADYQSSDRPPLQTGWLLLTWPVGRLLDFDPRAFSGTAAVWFELLWLPAAYGLLRTLRLPPARALAWTAALSLAGFFVQNTVYTWPKLPAAAFTLAAFALLFLPERARAPLSGSQPSTLDSQLAAPAAAALAALAWLSHGGVAFAFLALAPFLLVRFLRDLRPRGLRPWLVAAAALAVLALPWLAYQKFYDPPGDLLFREHIVGAIERDHRGGWESLRDAYRALPWSEILARKQANLSAQFGGSFVSLFDFSPTGAPARRSDEFFHTFRALGPWLLAPLVMLVALFFPAPRARLRAVWPAHAALLGWTALTLLVWCLLMFHGGRAVIHQGPYTLLLALFVLAAAGFELAGRAWLPLVAAFQLLVLATTYAVTNSRIHGPALGLPVLLLAAAAVLFLVVRQLLRPSAS